MTIYKLFNIALIFCVLSFAQSKQINILEIGANGNDKIDDTVYFQRAIDELAKNGGGTINIPSGKYYISHLFFLGKQFSNIRIIGNKSIIYQITPEKRKTIGNFKTFADRNAADGCFIFDAQVSNQKDDSQSIKNIYISGLNFISEVEKKGFDELLHQISAHGVSYFTITNCTFTGFMGDAVAINGSTDFSTFRNAYNKNIKIKDCIFDGVNKDNRQAISIYYSDGFLIENCTFKNVTRPNMPGAIDIESDVSTTVNRNGKITNCKFENIGGIAAVVFHILPSNKENDFSYKNFIVENSNFNNCNAAVTVIGNDRFQDSNLNDNVIVLKNLYVSNCLILFDFRKAYGILIDKVQAYNIYTKVHNIVSDGGARNITFKNCIFNTFENPAGLGFTGETYSISFENNSFENFTSTAITINSASGIGTIENNKFVSTKAKSSLPLITHYFANKNLVKNAHISGNLSFQNFEKINLDYFYQLK